MLDIQCISIDGMAEPSLVDNPNPTFRVIVTSSHQKEELTSVTMTLSNGEKKESISDTSWRYEGQSLKAFGLYELTVTITNTHQERATKTLRFEIGRLSVSWVGRYITGSIRHSKVLSFHKDIVPKKTVKEARLYLSAIGTYQAFVNQKPLTDTVILEGGEKTYQVYDGKELLKDGGNDFDVRVFASGNKDPMLVYEWHLIYDDDTFDVIGSDDTTGVSQKSPYRYEDGVLCYDDTYTKDSLSYHPSQFVSQPKDLLASESFRYRADETLMPILSQTSQGIRFDFATRARRQLVFSYRKGQAGQSVSLRLFSGDQESEAQTIRILLRDGDGQWAFVPERGFRSAEVTGIDKDLFSLTARRLKSMTATGMDFSGEEKDLVSLMTGEDCQQGFDSLPAFCPADNAYFGYLVKTGDVGLALTRENEMLESRSMSALPVALALYRYLGDSTYLSRAFDTLKPTIIRHSRHLNRNALFGHRLGNTVQAFYELQLLTESAGILGRMSETEDIQSLKAALFSRLDASLDKLDADRLSLVYPYLGKQQQATVLARMASKLMAMDATGIMPSGLLLPLTLVSDNVSERICQEFLSGKYHDPLYHLSMMSAFFGLTFSTHGMSEITINTAVLRKRGGFDMTLALPRGRMVIALKKDEKTASLRLIVPYGMTAHLEDASGQDETLPDGTYLKTLVL